MNKLNILMIGPGRKVKGGISTVVDNYYKCGLDKAVNLTYLATMEDGGKIRKLFVAVKAFLSYSRLVKKTDIVHVHMAAQASFDRKALFIQKAKQAGKIVIIHQHAADFDKYFFEQVNEKKRARIKEIFGMASKVIVLSEEWADFFGKYVCASEIIEVLHNGVLMPEYVKQDYSDHNVLMLGRLGVRKGTYDLLDAIPMIKKAIPDVAFFLCGDGDVEQCKMIAKEKELEENVYFSGWVQDGEKERLLQSCSTFILPSYHEGMPMSVLEAMSYGLITVSTNAGGIPQIIEDGIDGFRIDAGDVKAIEHTLINVLNKEEEEKKRMGMAARSKIERHFSIDLEILTDIYRAVGG